jgi:hypothetical protein
MKAYLDLTINGHAVAVEVEYDYVIDPNPVITTVRLGGTEIIHTLDDQDMTHICWCADQDYKHMRSCLDKSRTVRHG